MRNAVAGVAVGLALAVGVPVGWELTRPPATAGAPVAQVLPTDPPAPSSPGTAAPAPAVDTRAAAPTAVPQAPAPTRVAVPAWGVDAPLDPMGVSPDGQMALPEDVDRVGWYRFGPVPGEAGSAVLAGHVDDREQGLGALAPLRDAAVGDEVLVADEAGTTSRWQVTSRELITKQELPLDRLFAREGEPRLVLMTCGGPFLPEYRSYRDNVVVVAEPVR
ncbi:sortase domain-bontaining protein [uncultured Modestobacter sp.]|uniref:sortase domain-containing protein n=1 Tax=uncultured Modestobacter sp. TaxID=380048 RepID=UPI00260797FF|nr:sortase [uncultured Modestobacter sp.]